MTREQRIAFERFRDISEFTTNSFISQDLFRFVCGDKIGAGAYREVYQYSPAKDYVIKIAEDEMANYNEYSVWLFVKDTKYKKWFAPCLSISPCGHFLVQKRVRSITDSDKLPKVLPSFFTDIKKTNWGFMGKQLVCHDYQFLCNAIECSFATNRKVVWRD